MSKQTADFGIFHDLTENNNNGKGIIQYNRLTEPASR